MILGHSKQIEFLKKILKSGKIPQALLFSGQEKLGKKRVALEFAFWILKENPISHPDFLLIEPKENVIQIDQIRELNWHLSLTPIKSNFKIAILDSAHLMTKEAQNSFLKTLEEPRGNCLIILITPFPEALLSTIVSRCQKIKFFPLKRKEIEEFLEKMKIKNKEKILELVQGRPGVLFEILKEKRLEEIEGKIENFQNLSFFERLEFLKKVDPQKFLEILIFKLRKKIFDQKERKRVIEILKLIQNFETSSFNFKFDKKMTLEILCFEI